MALFIILGAVVIIAVVVLGFLFYLLSKEGQREEASAVPVTDLSEINKELSNQLFEQNNSKVIEKDDEIIPVFQLKVNKPLEKAQSNQEDEAYKKRAQHLEDELLAISKKADGQSDEAKRLIETLSEENDALKIQKASLELAQEKLNEVQVEAEKLKTENITLQTQLETTNSRVQYLEQEMTAVKMQMGEEISQANAKIIELSREKETMAAEIKVEPDEALRQEVEALKVEKAQLNQKCDDLAKAQEELTAQNSQLTERIDSMQYELVKARAQSSGLERISFNYKNQLEDFLNKVTLAQSTNDQLTQAKNRLEGLVEEVKSHNEELIKKDSLSQFELEKNRSRLVSLERECEELKSRIQQQGQQ